MKSVGYSKFIITCFALISVCTVVKGEKLKNLIPSSSELSEFRMIEKPEYYDQDNLWDYINGASPGYIAYGFQEMVTFVVQHRNNKIEIVTDIYDMGDSLHAFGIFSVERSPESSSKEFGSDSYQSDNTLYFWQDRYYVKITAFDISNETAKSLSLLAQIMTKKLPRKGGRPFLFSIFPEIGQLPGSERFITSDVLGQNYLNNGYLSEYEQEGNRYQIIIIQGENRHETKQDYVKYLSFLKSIGQITAVHQRLGEQAFVGIDNFYGTILFSYKGAYLVGVLGVQDLQISQELINSIFLQINNISDR